MSELSGVFSLIFIGMAFLTSCSPNETPKAEEPGPLAMLIAK